MIVLCIVVTIILIALVFEIEEEKQMKRMQRSRDCQVEFEKFLQDLDRKHGKD